MDTRKFAFRLAQAARSKKAQKVVILDMRKVSNFCDYFVIASGTSSRHVNTIAQAIEEDAAREKIAPRSRVSYNDESGWMVLDFSSVIAHVFHKPLRDFYALERLWSDAKKVRSQKV